MFKIYMHHNPRNKHNPIYKKWTKMSPEDDWRDYIKRFSIMNKDIILLKTKLYSYVEEIVSLLCKIGIRAGELLE